MKKRVQLGQAEWIAGVFVSLLVCWLHFLFVRYAGGLWRDEVVTFNVAAQPSLGKFWESMHFDSFPGFFHLILRAWIFLGLGGTDHGLRLLGCGIGLAIVVAFWINGRLLHFRVPVLSLTLFALSALTVRTTDAIRAYGLGSLCIILTVGLVWKVVESPSPGGAFLAAIAAILSVQSLYQNAFLLFAICLGAAAVTLRGRRWREFAVVAGIGLFALLSLAVDIPAILQTKEISELVPRGVSFRRLILVFLAALGDGGNFMLWGWVILILGGLITGIGRQVAGGREETPDRGRDLALFSVVTLVAVVCVFFLWLKLLSFPTQPWYFVPLIAVMAVCLDAIFGTLPSSWEVRLTRLIFLIGFAIPIFFRAIPNARIRQTNVDMVAVELEKIAAKDDLIIVIPWYFGPTFSRYFHGPTLWMTVPPLEDQTLQRLDLFKAQMMLANPIEPVREKARATLMSGHRVWLVGSPPSPLPPDLPAELPAAPDRVWGWNHNVYSDTWNVQIVRFLESHGLRAKPVPIAVHQRINQFENAPLADVSGWVWQKDL